MSRQDFMPSAPLCVATRFCYVVTRLLFLVLESLSRHRKFFRDRVYLCSIYLCVATLISLLRHQTSLQLEACRNTELFCCNHVTSLSQHHLSRLFFSLSRPETLSFSVVTFITLSQQNFFIQCLNRLFQVAIISVTTREDFVTTREDFVTT